MPGLLDLPPELIELIFRYEDSVRRIRQASKVEDWADHAITAPLFRLANRYVEQCTRRIFAQSFFCVQRIMMPKDASIKRFCDIARYPELVKHVNGLHFYVANDQRGRLEISSVTRNEIVDALRACPATCEVVFRDASREEDDDLQREDRTAEELATLASRIVIDMSSSFSFVLSVAEEAGMRPDWINTWTFEEWGKSLFGLVDCSAIAERNTIVSDVEVLNIAIIPPRPGHEVTPADMGLRIAQQLEIGLSNMPALRILELSFFTDTASSISAWSLLANIPKLLNLEKLVLHGCNMSFTDMEQFILKQIDTLRILHLSMLCLHEGTLTEMSLFYAQMSTVSKLVYYYQYGVALVTGTVNRYWLRYVGLPRHLCLPKADKDENEEGYIEVGVFDKMIS